MGRRLWGRRSFGGGRARLHLTISIRRRSSAAGFSRVCRHHYDISLAIALERSSRIWPSEAERESSEILLSRTFMKSSIAVDCCSGYADALKPAADSRLRDRLCEVPRFPNALRLWFRHLRYRGSSGKARDYDLPWEISLKPLERLNLGPAAARSYGGATRAGARLHDQILRETTTPSLVRTWKYS